MLQLGQGKPSNIFQCFTPFYKLLVNRIILITENSQSLHIKHKMSKTFYCQSAIKHGGKIKHLHEKFRIFDNINRKPFDYFEHLTMAKESLLISAVLLNIVMAKSCQIFLLLNKRVKLVHGFYESFTVDMKLKLVNVYRRQFNSLFKLAMPQLFVCYSLRNRTKSQTHSKIFFINITWFMKKIV